MKSLLEIRESITSIEGEKILLYGAPNSGKTVAAATIAKAPHISTIYWFDLDGGIRSVLSTNSLTEEELAKIKYIRVRDTTDYPVAAETFLKAFTAPKAVSICQVHGKISCTKCATQDKVEFNFPALGSSDAIIIDSGSQLADSVLALAQLQHDYRDLRKYYGEFTDDMVAILSKIQAAQTTVIFVTHELEIYKDVKQGKEIVPVLDKIVPLCGSRNFSRKLSKYFTHTIYARVREGGIYELVSSAKTKLRVDVGTRGGIDLSEYEEPTLLPLVGVEAPKKQSSIKLSKVKAK